MCVTCSRHHCPPILSPRFLGAGLNWFSLFIFSQNKCRNEPDSCCCQSAPDKRIKWKWKRHWSQRCHLYLYFLSSKLATLLKKTLFRTSRKKLFLLRGTINLLLCFICHADLLPKKSPKQAEKNTNLKSDSHGKALRSCDPPNHQTITVLKFPSN